MRYVLMASKFDGREQPNSPTHISYHELFSVIIILSLTQKNFSRLQDYYLAHNHHPESIYELYCLFFIHRIFIISLLLPLFSWEIVRKCVWNLLRHYDILLAQNSVFVLCKLPVISIWSSCYYACTTIR